MRPVHENDSLGCPTPNRTPPRHAHLHQGDAVDGDVGPGAGVPDRHDAIRWLARVPRRIRDVINRLPPGHVYDPNNYDDHTLAAAGGDCGDGDTSTDDRATAYHRPDPDMPTAGPERPRPYLLYSNGRTDAAANCCPVDSQTAADLWHNTGRGVHDESK
jgi:hypothetical protein